MRESVSVKILVFNIVSALIALAGYLLHVTDSVHVIYKYLFYPLYGYVMLSFITAAIAVAWGVLERQKGLEAAKIGVWGNGLYIVALIVGLLTIWVSHHPQSIS
ncbi:hypothetical protein [Hydrogenimonas sp.]